MLSEPDAHCPGEWVDLDPTFGYCSLGDECRNPVADAHAVRIREWNLEDLAVQTVRDLAPDGDWVRLQDVASRLRLDAVETREVLDQAVRIGRLGYSFWEALTINGIAFGQDDHLYRINPHA